MTATAFVLDQPEVVAGEAELSPKSKDVSGVSEDKVITGKNRQTQLTIPGIWSDADKSWRKKKAIIHVGNQLREEELWIFRLGKARLPAFPEFHRRSIAGFKKETDTVFAVPPRRRDIGGLPSVQYWMTRPDELFEDVIVYVRGRKAFYIMVGIGLDPNDAMAATTISSFREITPDT